MIGKKVSNGWKKSGRRRGISGECATGGDENQLRAPGARAATDGVGEVGKKPAGQGRWVPCPARAAGFGEFSEGFDGGDGGVGVDAEVAPELEVAFGGGHARVGDAKVPQGDVLAEGRRADQAGEAADAVGQRADQAVFDGDDAVGIAVEPRLEAVLGERQFLCG